MSVSITTQWLHRMEEDTTATANWMNGLTLSRYLTLKYRHQFCCQVGRELTMVVGIHSTLRFGLVLVIRQVNQNSKSFLAGWDVVLLVKVKS